MQMLVFDRQDYLNIYPLLIFETYLMPSGLPYSIFKPK